MPSARWKDIAADLRRRIHSGDYRPEERIPPQRELCRIYGTKSPNVISRAIGQLVAEGLLATDPARPSDGVRVRDHLVRRDMVAGLLGEGGRVAAGEIYPEGYFELATGLSPDPPEITYEWSPAEGAIAHDLRVSPGVDLLVRTYLWRVDGRPYMLSVSHMPAALAASAGLTSPRSEVRGVATGTHLRRAGVTGVARAAVSVGARMPTEHETALLQIGPGDALCVHTQMLIIGEVPVERDQSLTSGGRTLYTLDIPLGHWGHEEEEPCP